MTYSERLELYKKIEQIRNRPLVVYVTSSRQNANAAMAGDVIPHFIKQLIALPNPTEALDILIVSNGGDAIVPWRIMSMIREQCNKVGVLIPYAAYSAATVLALGADEIIMHPFANLGPVDPQLVYRRVTPGKNGGQDVITGTFGSEDLRNFFEFVHHDVKISDQQYLQKAFELIATEVGAIQIGTAKRATQLALSMGEKLLSLHLQDNTQAKAITAALNSSFYHHGYPLSFTEAQKIGLPVKLAEDNLREYMWAVWESLEEEMQCNVPFDPVMTVLNHEEAAKLTPVKQVSIPANLPPQLAQQVYQNVMQQIKVDDAIVVEYEHFQATVESLRCRSEYRTHGRLTAVRFPDMNMTINNMPYSQCWKFFENSENQEDA